MVEEQPQRIAVIGCAGAGKSTLARALAAASGLPLIHLDREHWQPGWVEPDEAAWQTHNARLIAGERWIIDGHYGSALAARLGRATLVIWLDLPTHACLIGVLRRWWRWRGQVRPDMGPGCPEKMDGDFLRFVLTFRRRVRPRIVAALAASGAPTVRLASTVERTSLLRQIERGQGMARLASSRIDMP